MIRSKISSIYGMIRSKISSIYGIIRSQIISIYGDKTIIITNTGGGEFKSQNNQKLILKINFDAIEAYLIFIIRGEGGQLAELVKVREFSSVNKFMDEKKMLNMKIRQNLHLKTPARGKFFHP